MIQILLGPLVAIGLILLAKRMFNYLDGDHTNQKEYDQYNQ